MTKSRKILQLLVLLLGLMSTTAVCSTTVGIGSRSKAAFRSAGDLSPLRRRSGRTKNPAVVAVGGRLPSFSPSSTFLSSSTSSHEPPPFRLDPSETAFVFIEYQNEFTTEGGKFHDGVKDVMARTNMLENSSRLLRFARAARCTVVHCPISFEPVRFLARVEEI